MSVTSSSITPILAGFSLLETTMVVWQSLGSIRLKNCFHPHCVHGTVFFSFSFVQPLLMSSGKMSSCPSLIFPAFIIMHSSLAFSFLSFWCPPIHRSRSVQCCHCWRLCLDQNYSWLKFKHGFKLNFCLLYKWSQKIWNPLKSWQSLITVQFYMWSSSCWRHHIYLFVLM